MNVGGKPGKGASFHQTATTLAKELSGILDQASSGKALELKGVTAVQGEKTIYTGVRASPKSFSLLPGARKKQIANARAGLQAIAVQIRNNPLLMQDEYVQRAVTWVEDKFIYNEKLARLDLADVSSHFKTVIEAAGQLNDEKVQEYDAALGTEHEVAKQAVLNSISDSLQETTDTPAHLAAVLFRNGEVADKLKANADLANGSKQPPSPSSPLEQTLAGLGPLYSRLADWAGADKRSPHSEEERRQLARHQNFNVVLHDHLSASPLLKEKFDTTGAVAARVAQAATRPSMFIPELAQAIATNDVKKFQVKCAEVVDVLVATAVTLLEIGRTLVSVARNFPPGSEEHEVAAEMSAALIALSARMLAQESPYMALYQFTKAGSDPDPKRAEALMSAAKRILPPPC